MQSRAIILHWSLVWPISIGLYALSLLLIPLSITYSMVFLFALFGFWSRLPGVGIPTPFYLFYLMDFVDFFSLVVAVNIGGIQGALFSAFLNLSSRMCGITPAWVGVAKDTVAQFMVCLIIPFVYTWTGSGIVMGMVWYTILRLIMFFPMQVFFPTRSWTSFLTDVIICLPLAIFINVFYAKILGNFLTETLQQGVAFNWTLFIIATVVMLCILFMKHSKKLLNKGKSIISKPKSPEI